MKSSVFVTLHHGAPVLCLGVPAPGQAWYTHREAVLSLFLVHRGGQKAWSDDDHKPRSDKAGISLRISDRQGEARGISLIFKHVVYMGRLGIREAC